MSPSALIIIDTDPRHSGKPAEALRIAAGIAVWKKVDVAVYLGGDAARMLDADPDDLVDGSDIARYAPMLAESGRGIFVQQGALAGRDANPLVPCEEISTARLAELSAARECVLRF